MSDSMDNLHKIQAVIQDDDSSNAVRKMLGPEGYAVLDTLRAAVHARRAVLGENASFERMMEGNSPAAAFLRSYMQASDLFAFGSAVARKVLPYNGALMLTMSDNTLLLGGDFSTNSGRSAADIFTAFGKTLEDEKIVRRGEEKADKLRKRKQALVKENARTTCMALCNEEWSIKGWLGKSKKKKALKGPVADCGGAHRGYRCQNLVATLSSDGKIIGNLAGFHVDMSKIDESAAKAFMQKAWKAGKATFQHMLTGVVSENEVTGVGEWADKHLVSGWRQIDDGKIHICHHHAEIIRKKNPAYYMMLVASTLGRMLIATKMQSLVDYWRAEEIVQEGLSDGVITATERQRMNNALSKLDPEARALAVRSFANAKYKGSNTPLMFQNDQLLSENEAARKAKSMRAFLKDNAIDRDGWTPKDRKAFDEKFGGLKAFRKDESGQPQLANATTNADDNEYVKWSALVDKATKASDGDGSGEREGEITLEEYKQLQQAGKNLKGLDVSNNERVNVGTKMHLKETIRKGMEDGQLTVEERKNITSTMFGLDQQLDDADRDAIREGRENFNYVQDVKKDGWVSTEEEKELARRGVTDSKVSAMIEKNREERAFFDKAVSDARVDAEEEAKMKTMSKGARKHYRDIVEAGKTIHRLLEAPSSSTTNTLSFDEQKTRVALSDKEEKQLRSQMKKHPAGTPLGDQLRARLSSVQSTYKTADGLPPTKKQFAKLAKVEALAKGALTPLEEKQAKLAMGKDWKTFNMEDSEAVKTGRRVFGEKMQRLESEGLDDGFITKEEDMAIDKDIHAYLEKSGDDVAKKYREGRRLHKLAAAAARKGGGIDRDVQKKLAEAMRSNSKVADTIRKMGFHHLRSDGLPASQAEVKLLERSKKYVNDGFVIDAENKIIEKMGGSENALRLLDPELAEKYSAAREKGRELVGKLDELGKGGHVMLGNDVITLSDGTTVSAKKAMGVAKTIARTGIAVDAGVKQLVDRVNAVNAIETAVKKGKLNKGISEKDAKTLRDLPDAQRAEVYDQISRNGGKMFTHGTSTRRGQPMTKADVAAVASMKKVRKKLTAVGDWEKLSMAASWTDGAAMQKMITALEKKRATVAEYETKYGDKFDDYRREAGAVGTGQIGYGEDPLDSKYIDSKISELKEKIKTTRWYHINYRAKEAAVGAAQIATDTGQGAVNVGKSMGAKTVDAAKQSKRWAFREDAPEVVDLDESLDDSEALSRDSFDSDLVELEPAILRAGGGMTPFGDHSVSLF